MASTFKTPNLGLCQWVLDDPFLMEDMNADNRKIDEAAMKAKLFDMELQAPGANIEFDFSELALSKFLKLEIWLCFDGANGCMRVNGYSNANYKKYAPHSNTSESYLPTMDGCCQLTLIGSKLVMELPMPHMYGCGTLDYSYIGASGINALNFFRSGGSTFPAGSQFVIYGVRR